MTSPTEMSGCVFAELPEPEGKCPCGRPVRVAMIATRTGETLGRFCGPACGLYAARLGFPARFPALRGHNADANRGTEK